MNKIQVMVPRLIPSPPNGSSRAIIQDQGGPKSPNSSAITWISDEVMSSTKILETSNELDEAGQDEDTVSLKNFAKKSTISMIVVCLLT